MKSSRQVNVWHTKSISYHENRYGDSFDQARTLSPCIAIASIACWSPFKGSNSSLLANLAKAPLEHVLDALSPAALAVTSVAAA